MGLSEWYKIDIQKNTAGYPFGGEGPVPYYYKTASHYANVSLTLGLVFLTLLLFCLAAIWKRKKTQTAIVFGLTLLALISAIVHGQIGTN
jgi:hypothetical protein